MSETPQTIEYRGNCHCGAFKFIVKSPTLKQALLCNCSFCSKNGYLWAFPEELTVVKGDEDTTLKSYEFAKRTLAFKFCPVCGTSVLARSLDGKLAINIRALADVDFDSLPAVLTTDGASKEPLYQIPEPVPVENVPEGSIVYHGNCHCGAVGFTLVTQDKITEATDCNCSICSRDAALWIYPLTTSITFKGLDSLTEYTFANRNTFHGFCSICGVAIRERFTAIEDPVMALNIRAMHGLNLSAVELTKEDGKADLPAYPAWDRL
ncbi:GFA domain-containing protein [Mycena venus]|uniref:GFA domain-containing protein n=1 Tax=Mycena venus TaxID=2733690 RepID=A0A8H6YDD5_9AGAR|nr:GFA domain-containing protein [Mycena venus]